MPRILPETRGDTAIAGHLPQVMAQAGPTD